MLSLLFRRALPLLILGGITLTSCVVHDHDRGRDYGRRGRDYGRHDHDRGHGRGHHDRGYGYGRR
jgi:hypothetical protein